MQHASEQFVSITNIYRGGGVQSLLWPNKKQVPQNLFYTDYTDYTHTDRVTFWAPIGAKNSAAAAADTVNVG